MHYLWIAFAIVAAVSQLSIVISHVADNFERGCIATFVEGITAVLLVWIALLTIKHWW